MPRRVRLMALTATATLSTRKFIIKNLNMQDTSIVYVPPLKNNIIYFVTDKPRGGISEAFQPIVDRLICERTWIELLYFVDCMMRSLVFIISFKGHLGNISHNLRGLPTTLNIEWWTSILTAHTPLSKSRF